MTATASSRIYRNVFRSVKNGAVAVAVIGLALAASFPTMAAAADNPSPPQQTLDEYASKLAAYEQARAQYAADSKAYWDLIASQRSARNKKRQNKQPILLSDYVLTQPPVYTGPEEPVNPVGPSVVPVRPTPAHIPVVADFLRDASDKFNFVPQQPVTEDDFRTAYAKIASAAGLSADQAVRIYSFEAGGNGTYQVQAGLEYNVPGAHAISTALGYNQLLSTNSVELLAEEGSQFVKQLQAKATKLNGPARDSLNAKIQILQKMIAFANSVPDEWDDHVRLGATPEGLGIHAANLDVDIGPLLQAQKLVNSVHFAKAKGYATPLTAAQLEMMNLMGDGSGFDMVTVPLDWAPQIPTSNFFDVGGYDDNTVVRKNDVVSTLLRATNAKMDSESTLPGAQALAKAFRSLR